MKKIRNVTYSMAFKVFLFIVLALSLAVGALTATAGSYLLSRDAYNLTELGFQCNAVGEVAYQHLDYICYGDEFNSYSDMKAEMERQKLEYGVGYSVSTTSFTRGYKNWEGPDTPFVYTRIVSDKKIAGIDYREHDWNYTIYVDPEFPNADEFRRAYLVSTQLYRWRNEVIIFAALSVLLFPVSFVWLLCNAGRRRGEEGVAASVLTPIPLDLLTVGFAAVALAAVWTVGNYGFGLDVERLIVVVLLGVFEVVWLTIFLREFALRVKLGKWWQNSLIYKIFCLVIRLGRALWSALARLVKGLPLIWRVAAVILLFTAAEILGISMIERPTFHRLFMFWMLEKVIVIPIILYCALAFKKLQKGSQALAEGDLSGKLDTGYLFGDFKEHGENLNRISDGISKAVEQRMRSERLKTELITNVSHDIKTPLTSVINYADLLGSAAADSNGAMDAAQIAEYSEVLVRQSQKLKKLLDDLLEASKATTGTLEVNLMPCALGVLLTQAAGEYEAKFAQKDLKLHIRQPEEEIRIMADGKHLWRVFDNLLGNICKYAQESSRVYLDIAKKDDRAEIIFRNMSQYELEISPEELEERFVRGDKSRNTEGNGLGLSIAKGLVELQNGAMDIVTDGDLFKVILSFPVLKNE